MLQSVCKGQTLQTVLLFEFEDHVDQNLYPQQRLSQSSEDVGMPIMFGDQLRTSISEDIQNVEQKWEKKHCE